MWRQGGAGSWHPPQARPITARKTTIGDHGNAEPEAGGAGGFRPAVYLAEPAACRGPPIHRPCEITRPEHDAWFARAIADPRRVYWIILDDDEPIGLANLVDIDPQNSKCAWAFYLGASDLRGKGIGSFGRAQGAGLRLPRAEAEQAVLRGADQQSGRGADAQALRLPGGGLLRQHVRKGGQFLDAHLLGLLRDDYLPQRDALVTMLRERGVQTGRPPTGPAPWPRAAGSTITSMLPASGVGVRSGLSTAS